MADRKVPEQPLAFYSKEGTISRYNLRKVNTKNAIIKTNAKKIYSLFYNLKFGELPFHLVRARRFKDLFENVLFNYEWLHAKLSSCPLQAVLSDFEDACNFVDNQSLVR